MNKYSIIIVIISLFIISCNKVDRVYENKDFLLETFKDTDILRRGQSILMRVKVDTSSYSYWFFEKSFSKNIVFQETCDIKKNSPYNKKEALKKLKGYMKIMNKYHIRGVSSEFSMQGITLQFYLKNDIDIFYVEDINNVTIKSWKSYVNSANKLDENWYWRERYSD